MYVITWNMGRDRAQHVARRELVALLSGRQPAVLALQEAGGYRDLLLDVMGPTYRLIQFDTSPGQRESAILVRRHTTLQAGQSWAARMTWRGWNRQTGIGGVTAPKWAPTILANHVRVVCVHLPPSIRWFRGVPVGPPLRVIAYRTYARRLVALLAQGANDRPQVVLGDFNATPRAAGRWSPKWIARQASMTISAPAGPTTGHRPDGPVDYALTRNCRIENLRVLADFQHGSDHDPVGFQVHTA